LIADRKGFLNKEELKCAEKEIENVMQKLMEKFTRLSASGETNEFLKKNSAFRLFIFALHN